MCRKERGGAGAKAPRPCSANERELKIPTVYPSLYDKSKQLREPARRHWKSLDMLYWSEYYMGRDQSREALEARYNALLGRYNGLSDAVRRDLEGLSISEQLHALREIARERGWAE